MDFIDFYAGINDNERRIDKVLKKLAENSSLSTIYSTIRKGLIRVNDKKVKSNIKIQTNDKISIAKFLIDNNQIIINTAIDSKKNSLNKTTNYLQNDFKNIETIFENQHIKIINKPYNINVHGTNSISEIIENEYKQKNDSSLSFVPGPLHRLDKKTTGLLAFSNSLIGAKWFSSAIKEKSIRKFYVGICLGSISSSQIWNDYIEQNENRKSNFYTMRIIPENEKSSMPSCQNLATTICTPLAHGIYKKNKITLCQYEIKTGKKHQIRCQSAFHNFPLLGDTAYNSKSIEEEQDFFLHAYKLIFPKNNELNLPDEITAPISKKFNFFLEQTLINWNGRLIIN